MNNINILPRGPSKNKLLQLIQITRDPISVFQQCKNIYGKTFTLRLLGQPNQVVISDPEHLKQVFSEKSNRLHAGEVNAKVFQPILGDYPLLGLDGMKHLEHRKLLLPPFHGERMKIYGELMANIAKRKILSWHTGCTLKLVDQASSMVFDIILSAIFGMDEKSTRLETLTHSLHALMRVLYKPFSIITLVTPLLHKNLGPLTPWASMMRLRHEVDKCLFEEITARKKLGPNSRIDILSLLLEARDETGSPMTDQEIRDEMLTLLMAGHDTSTMGIAWAFYGLLSNPIVYKKLKDELCHFVTNENDLIKNLDKLVYLEAVVKEALRVTPVLPNVLRITKEAYQLGEYTLPKGTIISPCIYLAHHDPQSWDEPDKFIPERFLNSTEMPYTYLPFGNGIRRCIGAAFAQYEMKIIIAQIILNAELELKENYKTKFEHKGVVISPSSGLPVTVKKIFR